MASPVVPTTLVHDAEAAAAEVNRLECPVALKAWGAAIVHKSDVGGVRLGVEGPDAVKAAFTEMADIAGRRHGRCGDPAHGG